MGIGDSIYTAVVAVKDLVWGWPLIILLLGTGLLLTQQLRGLQFRKLPKALMMALPGRGGSGGADGDISNFQALMTALSSTVGTGNIAGVATAITLGGPGALFWMWMVGLVGMATKYAEALLAVHYRITDKNGQMCGGPMYYLSRGLGWNRMAMAFSIFTAIAAMLGIGNIVQSNSIANGLASAFAIPHWVTGLTLAVATGLVLLGGIKSIGKVASVLVPTMILFYVGAASVILVMNADQLPDAFALVFESAFTNTAATGGFVGATMMIALRHGVARGLFSNESGLGSAPIAAAAAKTDHPAQQALISMTQTFIDTIVVCTLTGMVLIVTDVWKGDSTGAALTSQAFEQGFAGGKYIVSIGLLLFAWSTMLGWSYYGEKAIEYLAGEGMIRWYRMAFVVFAGLGAVMELDMVWALGDIFNGLMAIPNLLGLLALIPLIVTLTREYFDKHAS